MQTTKPIWASRVKEALDAQGHTAAWLADEIGIDRSTLSRMMRGYPDYHLTPDKARRIAKSLRIPYFWLFQDAAYPIACGILNRTEEELFGPADEQEA